jgi:hypothetical protein
MLSGERHLVASAPLTKTYKVLEYTLSRLRQSVKAE